MEPTNLRAEVCGYREQDGDPAEQRVDLIDQTTRETVASLTPDSAVLLAQGLCQEADRARARAGRS